MKLEIKEWDETSGASGAYEASFTEETALLHYRISHRFDDPAEAWFTIADADGTKAQKYGITSGDIYIGVAQVNFEDPTDTSIFKGRIMKATPNTNDRTVELYCQDWLSQLNDKLVDYDMRENLDVDDDLGYDGLRESYFMPNHDDGTFVGPAYRHEDAVDGAAYDHGSIVDDTTDANDAGTDDMNLMRAATAVNDAYYFGMDEPRRGISIVLSTQGDGTWTVTWEYCTGGDNWSALTGVTDGTSGWTAAAGTYDVTWTVPSDWETYTIIGKNIYWVRARISAFTSLNTEALGEQAFLLRDIVYDDNLTGAWDANEFDDKYLVLLDSMAGEITVSTGPYDEVVSAAQGAGDQDSGDETDLWTDDANVHLVEDTDENWTQDYYFRVYAGNNSATGFYVDDSISTAKIHCTHSFRDDDGDATCEVQIYDGADWQYVAEIKSYDNARGTIRTRSSWTIPDLWVSSCVDSSGVAKVRFNVTRGTNATQLGIYYIFFEVDVETTGYSTATQIIETFATPASLMVEGDFNDATTQVWHGLPYCIADPIYLHIESATGPIKGYDTMITLTCGTSNVENTSGISTRQFIKKTPLFITQSIAREDNAHFFIQLGTTTVTYQSTFAAGSADETLNDGDVLSWRSNLDIQTEFSEVYVQGMRIGDRVLESTASSSDSQTDYNCTRTKAIQDTGLVSEYETAAMATATLNQYKDVQRILTATIRGCTIKDHWKGTRDRIQLSDELQITSSYLNLSSAWYIVQRWEYDSKSNTTTLLLHPRVSTTGLQEDEKFSGELEFAKYRRGHMDRYIPKPADDTI